MDARTAGLASDTGLMKRAKRRRWVRRIVLGVVATGCIVLVGGWLALRHIPDWYRPLTVPADQLQRVRNSVTNRFSDISDRMVGGTAFKVSKSGPMITLPNLSAPAN